MGGGGENGGLHFFKEEHKGLERPKGGIWGGGGVSLIKARNFNLPYFGVMFEGDPELFVVSYWPQN